jgi:uncharacterized membrane protein
MIAANFFSGEEKEMIREAIQSAEASTSGEIRVHIDNRCKEDVMDRAAWWFEKLKLHRTEQRNGVLFYLAVKDKKFAILGDAGINKATPDDFWDHIKERMTEHFLKGEFAVGLSKGILLAGEALRTHFPHQADDVNELTDEISFGKS